MAKDHGISREETCLGISGLAGRRSSRGGVIPAKAGIQDRRMAGAYGSPAFAGATDSEPLYETGGIRRT